jgi:hypothetical protein
MPPELCVVGCPPGRASRRPRPQAFLLSFAVGAMGRGGQ